MIECCDNCKFSYGPFSVESFSMEYSFLRCRRYPPDTVDNTSWFPAVSSADWCGEWKAKEE